MSSGKMRFRWRALALAPLVFPFMFSLALCVDTKNPVSAFFLLHGSEQRLLLWRHYCVVRAGFVLSVQTYPASILQDLPSGHLSRDCHFLAGHVDKLSIQRA